MQIALGRDDEDLIGPDLQLFRDQVDRHVGMFRENLLEQGSDRPQMVDDDDGHTQIWGQVPQQPDVGIEAPGGTANADDGEIPWISHGFCSQSQFAACQ